MRCIIYMCLLIWGQKGIAQEDSLHTIWSVNLDSIFVRAEEKSWTQEDFIRFVLEDETLYRAFKQLRFTPYYSHHQIIFFDKKGKKTVEKDIFYQQKLKEKCRYGKVKVETGNKEFFKGKKQKKYYTELIHNRLFIALDTVCSQEKNSTSSPKGKGIEQYVEKLKKLVFAPGTENSVPLIGNRLELFSEKMRKIYQYDFYPTTYKGREVYMFVIAPNENVSRGKENKAIFKYFATYFDRESRQIIARKYKMKESNWAYDFDVEMQIELQRIDSCYIPSYIEYKGTWDVPLKKPESASIKINIKPSGEPALYLCQ